MIDHARKEKIQSNPRLFNLTFYLGIIIPLLHEQNKIAKSCAEGERLDFKDQINPDVVVICQTHVLTYSLLNLLL